MGLDQSGKDDLEQELLGHLWQRIRCYEPSRGAWQPFVVALIERKSINLLRDQRAPKRDPRRCQSLSTKVRRKGSETVDLGQTIGDRELRVRQHIQPRAADELARLRCDVSEVLERLPKLLREVAEGLKSKSIAEIARDMDYPRTTVQGWVREIRKRFERAGLADYVCD